MKPFNYLTNAVRAPEIVAIFVRWGFEDLLLQLDTPPFLLRNLVRNKVTDLTFHERIRNACEDLGPIFVKFGQILSARPDRLPEPLIMQLKKLRNHVDPQPFEKIKRVALKELDCELEDIFSEFDSEPVAAGSLGQVYRARLRSTGEEVAVKIQRAEIRKKISADMEIIAWFARQIHVRMEDFRPYNLPDLIREAKKRLEEELDYRNEANNTEIFRVLHSEQKDVYAPKVFREYSSPRLLITEWINGLTPDEIRLDSEEAERIARLGGESIFHQIVGTGFFHSDPHPGNVLITPDRRICLIDWGQAGQITPEMRYHLADMFAAITDLDTDKVLCIAEKMSRDNRLQDRLELEKKVTYLLNKHHKSGLRKTKMGTLGLELLYLFGKYGLNVSPDYALLSKSILCIEETAHTLAPGFDIKTVARPYLIQLNKERWSFSGIRRQTLYPLIRTVSSLQKIPENLQSILRRIEEKKLQINFHHTGTRDLRETFNAGVNRLTVGIILGALLVGSSLIITTGVEPFLFGYPVIGMLGFLISGLLGLYIVISTLQKPR